MPSDPCLFCGGQIDRSETVRMVTRYSCAKCWDPTDEPIARIRREACAIGEAEGYRLGRADGVEAAVKRLEEWHQVAKREQKESILDDGTEVTCADHAIRLVKALLEEKP